MAKGLEDILRLQETKGGVRDQFDYMQFDPAYAEAFRNYGIDVDSLPVGEAAERIRVRAIRLELATALDHWALLRFRKNVQMGDKANWQHLFAVARAADPDPWRTRFRDVLEHSPRDKQALQDLAASAEIASLPPRTLHLLAGYLGAAGAAETAITVYRQAQLRHADDFWINTDLASTLQGYDRPEEAIPFRMAAVAIRPQSTDAHYYLGLALRDKGAVEEAIASFKEAIRLMPEDAPGACINLGRLLLDKGAPGEALAAYDQAIATMKHLLAQEPRYVRARTILRRARDERAVALIALGRRQEAEQAYQELQQAVAEYLELDPADHFNWFDEAVVRLQRGDTDGYRWICREMLARFGQTVNPEVILTTATTCLLRPDAVQDLEPVRHLVQRALGVTEHSRSYPSYLLLSAMVDYRDGHFAKAVERLKKTLSLVPDTHNYNRFSRTNNLILAGNAHAFLAMAYHRLGEADQARLALDRATELVDQMDPTARGNKTPTMNSFGWLRLRLVWLEAEQIVKVDEEMRK
jgi:tetratricopeptide (TPR) repeat protein